MQRQRRHEITRKVVAIVALLGCLGIAATLIGGLVMQIFGDNPRQQPMPPRGTTRTSQPAPAPGPPIKPVSVRPVQEVRPIGPDQCPVGPPNPAPPADVLTTCDLTRTASYMLGPQVMELQLTRVESMKSPNSEFHVVRMTMQPASATSFATYTADHVGEQLAFVRNNIVVFAPKITQAITSPSLEISGNLGAQQAQDIARLLRAPA